MGALDATADKLVTSTCADQDVIEAAGPAVEGAYIFSTNDVTSNDPDTVTFRTVMAQYAPGTDIYGFAFSGYQPVLGLVRAMQSVPGDFTPDSVLHSLRAAKDVPIPRVRTDIHLRRHPGLHPALGMRSRRHRVHGEERQALRRAGHRIVSAERLEVATVGLAHAAYVEKARSVRLFAECRCATDGYGLGCGASTLQSSTLGFMPR